MKNSGIEWIGEIPDNWKISRINFLYTQRSTKVSDKNYPPLSVTKKGVLPQLENVAKTDDHNNRKLVLKGDFAINSRSDRRGSCGISNYDGSVSLINIVLKPNKDMFNRYFNQLFHTELFADEFYKYGHGIVDDLWTTTWQDMKKISVPLPPLEEQKKIADFLDNKCSKIDKYVEILTNQIKNLVEYKKSLITEIVTRGLNPDVKMKYSDIEWIGEIPDNWEICRIKNILSILTDYTANGSFADLAKNVEYLDYKDYARLVRLTDLRENLENKGIYVNKNSYEYLRKSKLFGKEILIANVGAYAGLFCEMPIIKEPATLGPNMFLLKTNNKMFQHFLYYLGNAKFVIEQLHQKATSTAQPKLNKDDVKTIYITLPSLEEQKAIADFLDCKCSKVDRLIELKKKQIENIKEYKKSLIYEYVTGKMEVK